MQTLEETEGDILIVSLGGHLDTMAAPPFEEGLMAKIAGGVRGVVIDCTGLTYVNSAGLKSFLLVAKQLESRGGKFIVCALSARISAVFEAIGFDQIMMTAATREDALKRLEGAAPSGAVTPV